MLDVKSCRFIIYVRYNYDHKREKMDSHENYTARQMMRPNVNQIYANYFQISQFIKLQTK